MVVSPAMSTCTPSEKGGSVHSHHAHMPCTTTTHPPACSNADINLPLHMPLHPNAGLWPPTVPPRQCVSTLAEEVRGLLLWTWLGPASYTLAPSFLAAVRSPWLGPFSNTHDLTRN
jgi:hypothetical protein